MFEFTRIKTKNYLKNKKYFEIKKYSKFIFHFEENKERRYFK